jgi:ATP-binding protein involved in chromosome partitioning
MPARLPELRSGVARLPAVISESAVRDALVGVIDPEIRRSVVELDMVRGVQVDGGRVDVTLALTVAGCPMRADLQRQVQERVGAVDGVAEVGVTFDVMTPEERTALRQRLQGGGATSERKPISIDPATRVVAVASGKGGVGKSTLTANLAAALAAGGAEVGVVDADIYGYSIPRMLGIDRRPVVMDGMIVPPVAHDLKVMSIGFFTDADAAVVWRGPMLHRALEQFLSDVHWGALDYLLVDMPPGTGDVSISLGQLLPEPDVVLVTTPQPAAQAVAKRAAEVAAKTGMRVAGVIENMSYLECPCCGERTHPFGTGGGAALASELAVPLLGQVPLDEPLRTGADAGDPLTRADPGAPSARAIAELAAALPGALRPRPAAERITRRLSVI